MLRKKLMIMLVLILSAGLIAACGSSNEKENKAPNSLEGSNEEAVPEENVQLEEQFEDVTITFGIRESYFNAEEFQRYIAEPTKEMYPHITVEFAG